MDEAAHINALHEAFMETQQKAFVGRKSLMRISQETLKNTKEGIIIVTGKAGYGKTAFLVNCYWCWWICKQASVFASFATSIHSTNVFGCDNNIPG